MLRNARLLALLVALFAFSFATPAVSFGAAKKSKGPSYPMKAAEFRKLVDQRIESVWGVVEKKLDRHGVTADRKKVIRRMLDDAAKDVRVQVDKAAADGTVTEAEGDKVKTLTAGLRGRLREKMAAEKKGGAKGDKPKDAKAKTADKPAKTADKPAKPADKPAKLDAGAKPKDKAAKPAKLETGAKKKAAKKVAPAKKKAAPAKPAKREPENI